LDDSRPTNPEVAIVSYQGRSPTEDVLSGAMAELPVWLLLIGGGIASIGIGALIVFLPPIFGAAGPAYPNPTDALGLATLFVVTGAGLVSGGLVAGLARIEETVSGRVRGHRCGASRRWR
jgi:hypothetical protein